jgi:hypothetical protein
MNNNTEQVFQEFDLQMKANLKKFYQEYALWLTTGAKRHRSFSRCTGLCSSLLKWCDANDIDTILIDEMEDQLRKAGLDVDIPFNTKASGNRGYHEETATHEAHLNESRRKWVFDHA